jgi:hypothetical protein
VDIWRKLFQTEPAFDDEIEESLALSCAYTAEYFAYILLERKIEPFILKLIPPLQSDVIEAFQSELEVRIYEELIQIEYDPLQPEQGCMEFERWVGCLEYGPNGVLAEVAENCGISPLYFPNQRGWYVNPGCVFNLEGEKFRIVNESDQIGIEKEAQA